MYCYTKRKKNSGFDNAPDGLGPKLNPGIGEIKTNHQLLEKKKYDTRGSD